ncbi:hypothetical protein AXK11_08855 [Cephaloticoccus primus]|uniref:Aldose 1-epimerase n=1 Tax=Cephaloticoccus primus TaxID=1548207 RepID=A0A139SHT2_9BACT|nr:aldose epimerase family protein [Cephaloticoccus primus]KXU34142.1 hypothetical protein AXK11_08855 [Cephaloticoccus primus]
MSSSPVSDPSAPPAPPARLEAHVIRNAAGASAEVLNYGGIVVSLRVPDRAGVFADVVLGFAEAERYLGAHPSFGEIVGRIAGRLTAGRLRLPDGSTHQLVLNDGPNHLHGGGAGFGRRFWEVRRVEADSITLHYHSPNGENGYPGALDVELTYTLRADNALVVQTSATSDRVTPLSMAQHSYFNLAGEGSGDALDHQVQIFAEHHIPAADAAMTLSGHLTPVGGTGNDLRQPRRLREVVPQLFGGHGEHYFIRATAAAADAPTRVARVYEEKSGRVLEVSTNECGLQFYTGAKLDGSLIGKSGCAYGPHAGICFEAQGYPDGAHRPELGDILVHPGTPQKRTTIYAFSVA